MNYPEYAGIIRDVPVSGSLKFDKAYLWPGEGRVPLKLTSLGDEESPVVRVPAWVTKWNGLRVPVVAISAGAFRGNGHVTDVILPPTLQSIPEGAFDGCVSLVNITIPAGVTRIPEGTFRGCVNLKNVYYGGSREEWERVEVVHCRYDVELGPLEPGTPIQSIRSERLTYIPGNEPLLTADIHFHCGEEADPVTFSVTTRGRDVTRALTDRDPDRN